MRKRYIVNWRFQLRYAVFVIIPIILIGLFVITIGFKVARETVCVQRQQLMVLISALESSVKDIEGFLANRIAAEKVLQNIKRLKAFSEDLVAINLLELRRITEMVAWAMVVLVFGAVVLGMLLSHRVAGPIFRLEKAIQEMGKEIEAVPIKVRATDEFQELASSVEQLRKALSDVSYKRKDSVIRLTKLVERIEKSLDKSLIDKQDVAMLKSEIAALERIC